MRSPTLPLIAALFTGGLLTLMTLFNGMVAAGTTPVFASFAAHGIGGVVAAVALAIQGRRKAVGDRAPLWSYFAGFAGAATVILTSATVNTPLALTGTIALGLAGQMAFGLVADLRGLFGLTPRRPSGRELVSFALIAAGSLIIIFYGRG